LFELAGLHPLNVEMGEPEEQESLAKTLLDRLGLPAVPGGEPQPL